MNAQVAYTYRHRKEEVTALGADAFRLQALQHLKLKTVIKESHASPVAALAFHHLDASAGNLFATVGRDQATVYDDLHMGDHIAVVVNLVNGATSHAAGGELQACAWLRAEGWTQHPHGDSLLAVAGAEGEISVISVAEARVVYLLKGQHSGAVVGLAACAGRPSLLASLGAGGEVCAWDVERERCTAAFQCSGATALALRPDGAEVLVAGPKNRVQAFALPAHSPQGDQENAGALGNVPAASPRRSRAVAKAEGQELALSPGLEGKGGVCEVAVLPGNRLVARSRDGWVATWDLGFRQRLQSWRVPGCTVGGGGARCRLASTPGGEVLAFGTDSGAVAVYDAGTGALIAKTPPPKVGGPALACGLSEDCRHVLVAAGNGFIFRYEYCRPEPAEPGPGPGPGPEGEAAEGPAEAEQEGS